MGSLHSWNYQRKQNRKRSEEERKEGREKDKEGEKERGRKGEREADKHSGLLRIKKILRDSRHKFYLPVCDSPMAVGLQA